MHRRLLPPPQTHPFLPDRMDSIRRWRRQRRHQPHDVLRVVVVIVVGQELTFVLISHNAGVLGFNSRAYPANQPWPTRELHYFTRIVLGGLCLGGNRGRRREGYVRRSSNAFKGNGRNLNNEQWIMHLRIWCYWDLYSYYHKAKI